MDKWPSKDPEYLTRVAKLHAWPGQGFDELYDNIEFEELDEDDPRTDWLINPKGQKVNGNATKETKGSKDKLGRRTVG